MTERAASPTEAFWADTDEEGALQRYRLLLDTLDDGVYQLDAEGRFVAVNDKIVEVTGYDRTDLLGSHVSVVLDDADTDRIERTIRDLLETNGDDVATLELRIQTAAGGTITCELRLRLLLIAGEFRGTVGVARDITERKKREQTSEQERELIDRVFEASPVGITALAPDGEVITLNQRALELFGMDPDDQLERYNEADWEVYDADDEPIPPEERTFGRVVETGEPVTEFEAQVERRDGGRVWLSFNGVPVSDFDDELSMIVLTFEDITELKGREQHLQRERRQTEKLLQTAPVAIAVQSAAGETITANQRAQDALGLSEQEIIDEPDDADEWTVYDAEGERLADDETPSARVFTTGEPVFDEEIAIEPPSGDRMWFRINAAPLRGPDGTIERVITAGEDITELKQREQQLERRKTELETELSETLGRISDAFYALDEEWRFTHVNERTEEILQHTEEELLGRSVWELFPDATEGIFWRKFHTAMQTQEPVSFEFYAEEFDAWLEFNAYPSETGLSIYFQNVTGRKEYERALEESERRYRTLVEHFPNGAVGLFDENLQYTAVGGELMDATGVDREERIGSSVYDIYPDEIVEEVESHFHAALGGEARSFEVEYLGRHLSAHTIPLKNDGGEVFAGMLVVQDVTENREMQRELRESEAKFRMLAENLEEIIWMATPDAKEFIYTNPAFEEVWGVDRDELYDDPLSFLDAIHPDDRERVREGFNALPEQEFDDEYRIIQPDGGVRWIYSRGARVQGEDGEMVRVVGIGEDITERKERQRRLEESERRYRTLAENFPNGAVGVYDDDLRYRLIEGAVLGGSMPSADALEGKTIAEIFPSDTLADLEPLFRAAIENGETGSSTTEFGEQIWRVWATPLRDADGEIFAGLSFSQDVTEQVEREQRLEEVVGKLEESNERLEQFAYAASHDLQEPLRMVSSYLQLIERRYAEELDADGEEFIEFAVDGADRMREMIDGLLKYSRVDVQGDPFEPVDLDAVLETALEDLLMKIEEHDAEITVESLPTVEGDRGQLRQVFQNLVSNAIEYSGDEPPQVHVSAHREDAKWIVSVSDEGIGIEPEEADRIFEVFQRLHTHEEYEGTGIGLALCQRIVERHGGEIWVDSEPGEGSTFSFTLPTVDGIERDRDE